MNLFNILLCVCIGVGLSAACGFRVFVPLLAMGIAARTGHLGLAENFMWMKSTPALISFGVATVLEVAGFYVPWVDHALDAVAAPVAVMAGVLASASTMTGEISPLFHWSIAIIGGGGAAAAVHGASALVRGGSTVTTGGFGNFLVATGELALATIMSFLAIVLPIVAAVIAVIVGILFIFLFLRWRRRKAAGRLEAEPA